MALELVLLMRYDYMCTLEITNLSLLFDSTSMSVLNRGIETRICICIGDAIYLSTNMSINMTDT